MYIFNLRYTEVRNPKGVCFSTRQFWFLSKPLRSAMGMTHVFRQRLNCDGLYQLLKSIGSDWNTIGVSIDCVDLCQTHCKQVPDFSRPSRRKYHTPSSYLRVNMGCALVTLFQVHSLYVPTNDRCGSPPGIIVADTLSFNAKMDLVDFWV